MYMVVASKILSETNMMVYDALVESLYLPIIIGICTILWINSALTSREIIVLTVLFGWVGSLF